MGIQGCHIGTLHKWILGPWIVGQRSHRSTRTISGESGQTATDTHILREPCIFKVEKEHEGRVFLTKHQYPSSKLHGVISGDRRIYHHLVYLCNFLHYPVNGVHFSVCIMCLWTTEATYQPYSIKMLAWFIIMNGSNSFYILLYRRVSKWILKGKSDS